MNGPDNQDRDICSQRCEIIATPSVIQDVEPMSHIPHVLEKLTRNCTGFLEIMYLAQRPDVWPKVREIKYISLPIPDFANVIDLDSAKWLNNAGYSIFFSYAPRAIKRPPLWTDTGLQWKRGHIEDVTALSCLWIDIDDPTLTIEQAQDKTFNIPAHLTFKTGGGWHLVWLFAEAIHNPRLMSHYLKQLAEMCGGDKNVDVTKMGRLPGFYNPKYPDKRLVTLEALDKDHMTPTRPYPSMDVFMRTIAQRAKRPLAPLPRPITLRPIVPNPYNDKPNIPQWISYRLTSSWPNGSRNQICYAMFRWLKDNQTLLNGEFTSLDTAITNAALINGLSPSEVAGCKRNGFSHANKGPQHPRSDIRRIRNARLQLSTV